MIRSLLCLFAILATGSLLAEKLPFDRYQTIIDRQMFGELPPGFDPTRPPSEVSKAEQRELSQEQEKLQSAIQFSVITVTPSGDTMVGFSDNSEKPPKHYYIKVGEESGGWLVREADPVAGTMVIVKNNIEVSLSIGGNSAKDPNANSRVAGVASAKPSMAGARQPGGLWNAARTPGGNADGAQGKSLRQLRMMRMQKAKEEAAAEEERRKEEEARKQEEEARKQAEEEDRAAVRETLLQLQEQMQKQRKEKEVNSDSAKSEEGAEGSAED